MIKQLGLASVLSLTLLGSGCAPFWALGGHGSFATAARMVEGISYAAAGITQVALASAEHVRQEKVTREERSQVEREAAELERAAHPLAGTRVVASLECADGRAFYVRCAAAQDGETCFYQADDGRAFSCADVRCTDVPAGILSICGGSQSLR
jgi:hypothetical protein